MTVEQSLLVAVRRTAAVSDLIRDVVSARQRAEKADPGDRSDVVRYEALCVRLERLAEQEISSGAETVTVSHPLPATGGYSFEDSLIAKDPERLSQRLPADLGSRVASWVPTATVVELRRGLEVGATPPAQEAQAPPDPAEPWRADEGVFGSRAVELRFRAQMEAVIESAGDGSSRTRGASINPSGINNRVITETLRRFVVGQPSAVVAAPVTYRDGSTAAHPFRLRCLPLTEDLPRTKPDLELHLALLSIRHTEMDPVVDGAWLRNAEVSRPRPAALTDDFVYETSRTQLLHLTDDGRQTVLLHIYQTGLDTAVVGFYRAVVDHMIEHAHSLSVVPMYFAASQQAAQEGSAHFRPSKHPWTLGEWS